MLRITFDAKNYVSLCEELKTFLNYSNIPTKEEPPTAPVVPATVQAPPVAPVAQPTPVAPVVPTSVSVPTTPEPQQAPPTPVVPVAPVKEYTLEEMQKYKVASLPELPKDQFPNLVVDLRNMGARI